MVLFATVLGLAHAQALPPGVTLAPAPTWVLPVSVPLDPSDPRTWLLVDDQALLQGPDTVRWSQQVSRMHTRADLQEQARVTVPFDPAEQHVQLHALEVYRDGRWTDRLATARGELIRREDALWQDILDGTQTLVLLPEDVARGDVLRASYSVVGDDPGFGAHTAWSWTLAWSVPVARRVLRVGTPVDGPAARWTVHGAELEAPAVAGRDPSLRWQTLDLQDLPAWPSPADLPLDIAPQPWVEVSTWADWEAVVDAFVDRYQPTPAPGLGPVLAAIDPGPDRAARVVAALRWTQESVRYLGLEMGTGSHSPRPLNAVLRSRYGDCKDKARLLVALLAAWDIAAWPALVDSRGADPRDAAPSPLAFDHVIVAIDWPDAPGGLLWVDPTRTDQGGPGAHPLHEGLATPPHVAALVLRRGERAPRPLPVAPPRARTATVQWELAAPDPTPVRARTTVSADEADQLRSWLAGADELTVADWQHPRWSAMGLPLAERARSLMSREAPDDNTLVLREELALEGFWWPDADGETAVVHAVDLVGWLPAPTPGREAPLALPGPGTWIETAVLKGITADSLQWPDQTLRLPAVTLRTWATTAETRTGEPAMAVHWELEVTADRVAGADLRAYGDGIHGLQDALAVGLRRHNGRIWGQPTTPPAPRAKATPGPAPATWAGVGAVGGLVLGLGLGLGVARRRQRPRTG